MIAPARAVSKMLLAVSRGVRHAPGNWRFAQAAAEKYNLRNVRVEPTVSEHFADRLLAAIERKGSPVCVGIDPVYERLPEELRGESPGRRGRLEAVGDFCRQVLQTVAPIAAAVKPQSAHFELYGGGGVDLYFDLCRTARDLGLIVIGDVKRNDIGSTAEAYAAAHLAAPDGPDAITVNAYLGADGLTPFVQAAAAGDKGVFVLVRTSNPSAGSVQDFAGADGKRLCEHIAAQVAGLGSGEGLIGRRGYSLLGAVVGATYPDQARRLRQIMPQQVFLVPGYGAQGATAADCAAAFKPDGTGAIVNASRSVIYAHRRQRYAGLKWTAAVEQAARDFAGAVAKAITT